MCNCFSMQFQKGNITSTEACLTIDCLISLSCFVSKLTETIIFSINRITTYIVTIFDIPKLNYLIFYFKLFVTLCIVTLVSIFRNLFIIHVNYLNYLKGVKEKSGNPSWKLLIGAKAVWSTFV